VYKRQEIYSAHSTFNEYEYDYQYNVENRHYKRFKSIIDFEPLKNHYLTASYSYEWFSSDEKFTLKDPDYVYTGTDSGTFEVDYGTVYRGHYCNLDWQYYIYRSKFDPGNLGIPFFLIDIEGELVRNSYPGYNPDDYDLYHNETGLVYKASGHIGKGWLFANSRISLGLNADGFSYFGGIKSGKVSLFMYDYIGRESLFSGYSYGSINVWRMTRFTGEIRLNPFIDIIDGISWYERMNLGIKIEAGYCDHFDLYTGMGTAVPVSIEGAFRFAFHLWAHRLRNVYFKIAAPLRTLDEDESDFRMYFGLTI